MQLINDIEFAQSYWLWLLLCIPLLLAWYIARGRKNNSKLTLSNTDALPKGSKKQLLQHFIFGLKLIALSALITAMARPQSATSWQNVSTEGIDIVIALDVSGSMLARDFKPDRLEAAKELAVQFIEKRPNDRIGLVVYAGEAFTQCPLTTDHAVLKNLFLNIEHGLITDGTAIGSGLATAVNRLKESEAISKVVILMTDGENNSGEISPLTAAEIAKTFDIRVHSIAVGTIGTAPMPVQVIGGQTIYQNMPVRIDEETLKKISNITGGQYYRATDNQSLEAIYSEIDTLEKSKIEVTEFRKRKEEFKPLAIFALACIFLAFTLRFTLLKQLS